MNDLNKKLAMLMQRVARLERGHEGRYYIDGSKIRNTVDLGFFIGENVIQLGLKRTRRSFVGTVFVTKDDLQSLISSNFQEDIKTGLFNFFHDEDLSFHSEDLFDFSDNVLNSVEMEDYERTMRLIENTTIGYKVVKSPRTGMYGMKITFS